MKNLFAHTVVKQIIATEQQILAQKFLGKEIERDRATKDYRMWYSIGRNDTA